MSLCREMIGQIIQLPPGDVVGVAVHPATFHRLLGERDSLDCIDPPFNSDKPKFFGQALVIDPKASETGYRIFVRCNMCSFRVKSYSDSIPETMTCDARTGKCSECGGKKIVAAYTSPDWVDAKR